MGQFYICVLDISFTYNSFGTDNDSFTNFYSYWIIPLPLLVFFDMVLKLNSGYFIDGLQMLDRKSIINFYLRTEFCFDFVSFLGVFLDNILKFSAEDPMYHMVIKLMFFMKYPILTKLIRKIEEIINFDEKIEAVISLSKLFSKMLFLSHVIACLWMTFPIFNPKENWMLAKEINQETVARKYVISLYWAFVTITTIGYGDVVPQNTNEYVFTTCVIIVGSMFYGYSLTSIASIFSELEKEEVAKK